MEGHVRDQLSAALDDDAVSVLTVEEAAAILRIGRGTAYAAAKRWRDTGGRDGLPVIALGRSLRVPAALLKRMLEDPTETPAADEAPGS